MRRFDREDRIELNNTNAGRPRKLTEAEERLVLCKITLNPRLSAPKITRDVSKEFKKDVNLETIRRILRRDGFNGRIARKKPLINERTRKSRLEYAREYYQKEESWWPDVLFSDESKFNVFGCDGSIRVWRQRDEEMKRCNLRPTVKHSGSVMVWGCMAASGVEQLVFIV